MNFGLFFIIPALVGYCFLNSLHLTRHRLVRDSGYHVLLKSAVAGGLILGFAHVIMLIVHNYLPSVITAWQSIILYPFADAVALGSLLSVVLSLAGNWIWDAEKSAAKVATDNGNHIELLIAESIENMDLVEITLKSRKSYIGSTLRGRLINVNEPDISLIPIASGYRNKDTMELEITTNYAPVIRKSFMEHTNF